MFRLFQSGPGFRCFGGFAPDSWCGESTPVVLFLFVSGFLQQSSVFLCSVASSSDRLALSFHAPSLSGSGSCLCDEIGLRVWLLSRSVRNPTFFTSWALRCWFGSFAMGA